MKNNYFFYLILGASLLFSTISKSQSINEKAAKMKTNIVQKLNAPTKIWINGGWIIKEDGTRVWEKGHWEFEEKTFQQKSQIFRRKLNEKNRV